MIFLEKSFLIFIWLVFLTPWVHASDLILQGIQPTEVERLKQELGDVFQGDLTYAKVDEIIRWLSRSGKYERVVAEEVGADKIKISAKPIRRVQGVEISGNASFASGELKDVMAIEIGSRFERKTVLEAGERLKEFYGERGYFNAVIEVSFERKDAGLLGIKVHITENEPTLISGIKVDSDNLDLKRRLETLLYRHKNSPLTSQTIEKIDSRAQSFLLNHRFLKASLVSKAPEYNSTKTRAQLVYKVEEPYRYEFYVDGYSFFSPQEIYRIMSLDSVDRMMIDPGAEIAERIRGQYLKSGFPNVEVTQATNTLSKYYLRKIFININENKRVHIHQITVTGRVSRPGSYYSKFLFKNSSPLIRQGYYNRADLEKGFENLLTELRNQGFLRAKIQSSRLDYLDKSNRAQVIVVIDEGPLTQVRDLTFEGASVFSHSQLTNALSLKINTPLRLTEVERAVDQLKSFYRSHGFLEMRLINEASELVEYSEKGTQAAIRFNIYEGPKVYVQSIHIEGNTFTDSDVILRSLSIEVGQVLTPEKIEESELRLNRFGIFNRVSLRTLEEGTTVSQRTLVISVVERDPGTFRFGAGVNSERTLTLRGFTGLSYNNLFGTGRAISGRVELKSHVVEVDYLQHEVAAGYLEPFLFGTRNRGRVNLTRSDRVFEFSQKDEETKITRSHKIDLLAERDLARNIRLIWKVWGMDSRTEFERFGRCIPTGNASFDPNSKCRPDTQQIATLGPTLDFDYLDHPFLPTQGVKTTFTIDYSDPAFASSEGIQFVRTEAGATKYNRLFDMDLIWQNTLRGGYVANLSPDESSGVPTSHAFFLGGLSTIRGFGGSSDIERLPPGNEFPVNRGNERLIKTDSHYILLKSEFRFTLFGNHGGAIFYDGGMVKVSGVELSRPYRDAVGLGYRYNTPVGPLNVDIGFKLNPRTDQGQKESPWRVHFSVGVF